MVEATITVGLDDAGNVVVGVEGVKGAACTDLTRPVEKLLGGEVVSRKLTAEYHETPTKTSTSATTRRG